MLKSTMFKKSLVVAAFTLGSAIALPAAAQSSAPVVCPGYEKGTTNLVGERVGGIHSGLSYCVASSSAKLGTGSVSRLRERYNQPGW